ncbi:hypothetical protein D3C85_1417060 [compost metagenome]
MRYMLFLPMQVWITNILMQAAALNFSTVPLKKPVIRKLRPFRIMKTSSRLTLKNIRPMKTATKTSV